MVDVKNTMPLVWNIFKKSSYCIFNWLKKESCSKFNMHLYLYMNILFIVQETRECPRDMIYPSCYRRYHTCDMRITANLTRFYYKEIHSSTPANCIDQLNTALFSCQGQRYSCGTEVIHGYLFIYYFFIEYISRVHPFKFQEKFCL